MSRTERPTDTELADREPTYEACVVCGRAYGGPKPQPYCSPECGRSQRL